MWLAAESASHSRGDRALTEILGKATIRLLRPDRLASVAAMPGTFTACKPKLAREERLWQLAAYFRARSKVA